MNEIDRTMVKTAGQPPSEPSDEIANPKRRSWFQFSLGTLVAILISVSAFSGVLSIMDNTAKEESIIVAQLTAYDAAVYFDYEFRNGEFLNNPKPQGWPWLRKQLGDNYFARVSYIQLPKGCPQEAFENLTKLKSLESIEIFNSRRIDDLKSLSDMWRLEYLSLGQCDSLVDLKPLKSLDRLDELRLPGCSSITDFSSLSSKKLKVLDITGSSITSLGFLEGMDSLEELYLENSQQLCDVSVLHQLTSLSKLDLRGCGNLTREQIDGLKASLKTTNLVSDF